MLLAIAKKYGQMEIAQWPTDKLALRFHSGSKPRLWLLRGVFQIVSRQRIISPGCRSTTTLCLRRRSSGAICVQRRRPCTPPVQGGLMDREVAFRLVECARKGVFFYFFVVQRGMDGDLPGKRKRDPQAQQMRLFFFYIVIFFSILEAHRFTLPHGLGARSPGKNSLNWVCAGPPPAAMACR